MMAIVAYCDPARKWRDRAKHVGFKVIDGRTIEDMTEKDAQEAFQTLSRRYGFSYIWNGE